MKSSIVASTLFLWSTSLASPTPTLSERAECGTVVSPAAFWEISERFRDTSNNLGSGGTNFNFRVSQESNNVNEKDLVASFVDIPCPPAGRGPYAIEFLYVPGNPYSYRGNTKIDMFAINGDLPQRDPTWNNIAPITGSLIGTFSLPQGSEESQQRLITINSVVCRPQLSFRFSITNDNAASGAVDYSQSIRNGLRIRYGC